MRGAAYIWDDLAIFDRHPTFKNGSHDTFLTPDLAFLNFPVCVKACKFRARSGAARRAVVFETGTENKISAVCVFRRAKYLDVIDLFTVFAGDIARRQSVADSNRKAG